MPGSAVQQSQLSGAMEKGIPFTFKTGGVRYKCHLQDRNAFERLRSSRTASSDSVNTTTTTSSASSAKSH